MATTWQHLKHTLNDNPIARRENVTLQRGRSKWFWRAAYGITGFLLIMPFLWGFSPPFFHHLSNILALLFLANVVVFPLVVIRTISTANQSMINERTGKTWDLLMLTGVGAWQLVIGKWLGTMRFMLRDYVWMFVLRVGTLIWGVAYLNMEQRYDYQLLRDSQSPLTVLDVQISNEMFFVILASITGFLVLEMMLSSALGLATSMFDWSKRAGNWTAIAIRIGTPIVFGLVLLYSLGIIGFGRDFRPAQYSDTTDMMLAMVVTNWGDNGSIGNLALASTAESSGTSLHITRIALLMGQTAGAVLYLLWIGIALSAARFFAFRQGVALDGLPFTGSSRKPKRKTKPQENVAPLPQRAERRVRVASGVENALGLDTPDAYRVELFQYQRRTGRLYLRLSGDADTRYVQFSRVAYMDAPMQWTGANLRVATTDERDQFITAHDIMLNKLTADDTQLYVLTTADTHKRVHLVAGALTLLDDAPPTV